MNFDHFGYNRKPGLPDFELIHAVRQALDVQITLLAGCQVISILIRRADDLNGCLHTKTVRIGNFKAQLAHVTLSEKRDRKGKDRDHKDKDEDDSGTEFEDRLQGKLLFSLAVVERVVIRSAAVIG